MNKKWTFQTSVVLVAFTVASAAFAAPQTPQHKGTSGAKTVTEYPLSVGFEFGKSDLKITPAAETQLASIAQELKNYPFAKLEIEGYADATGPEVINQKLSDDRASEVRKYLLQRYDISPERVVVRARGEKAPVATNATSEGRRQNRVAIARVYRLEPNTTGPSSHNL